MVPFDICIMMWCSACAHSLKKKRSLLTAKKYYIILKILHILYYRRGRWGLLLWAIQCQKMMWLRTERSNRFSTVQYGSDVLSYPFGKLLHQVMHLWSSKCCRAMWASWNGFQFFHMLCRQLHDHHVKQPSEGWYGWLMTFYSIVCSSRREDGILCLQLFLDYLQACQWQLLTINLILVDHASQTRLAFCTSCRKHVCFALYSPVELADPKTVFLSNLYRDRFAVDCKILQAIFPWLLRRICPSVRTPSDRLINQDDRQHILWHDKLDRQDSVSCSVCVCLLAWWVVETAIAK